MYVSSYNTGLVSYPKVANFTPVMSGGDGEECGSDISVESSGDFCKIIFLYLLVMEKSLN